MIEKIHWLGHATFKIKDKTTIYIDPWKLKNRDEADLILVTHDHFDHFSLEDIKKIQGDRTVVVGPETIKSKIKGTFFKAEPGSVINHQDVKIDVVHAYNINKFKEPGAVFHPKSGDMVGYILTIDGKKIYHTGDSDFIKEMTGIKGIDFMLIPVSGTYVMTFDEAAQAVNTIKPVTAIPMHYGEIVGSESDALKFKQLSKCNVVIKNKEGT